MSRFEITVMMSILKITEDIQIDSHDGFNIKANDMKKLYQYKMHLMKNPRLVYLFLELTNRCNLSCWHCGSNCDSSNAIFLELDDIKRLLKSVAARYDPKFVMICLTGGEPLLHPDFFEIVKQVRSNGFSCGMTTNGTLIDQAVAQRLIGAGIGSITISLDGLRQTHDRFRNSIGSYQKGAAAIKHLAKYSDGSVLIQVTTVIHKGNINDLEKMYAQFSKLPIVSWRVINIEPIGRALLHKNMFLDGDDFKVLLDFIMRKRYDNATTIDVTYGCSHYLTVECERTVRDNYFICGSGIYVASVLSNGDIYSCLDIERREELVQGNIKTDNFIDVWENKFEVYREDRTKRCELCSKCDEKEYCGGDSMHTWNFDSNQPMVCLKNNIYR